MFKTTIGDVSDLLKLRQGDGDVYSDLVYEIPKNVDEAWIVLDEEDGNKLHEKPPQQGSSLEPDIAGKPRLSLKNIIRCQLEMQIGWLQRGDVYMQWWVKEIPVTPNLRTSINRAKRLFFDI